MRIYFAVKTPFIAFLICAIISTQQVKASDNNRIFHYITDVDGLSYSAVSDIAQDESGFIWIATSKGLNLYDSNTIKRYFANDDKNSIPHNKINRLLHSTTGKLLIGTANGLCVYNKSLDNFNQIEYKGYSLLKIFSISELSNKKILITSSRGNYILSTDSMVIKEFSNNNSFKWADEDMYHNIWAYNSIEMFQLSPDGKILKSQPILADAKGKIAISNAFIDSRGTLWVGTVEDGLFRYNRNSEVFDPIDIDNSNPDVILKYIRDISEDEFGRLWIGTENGLFIYNHGINDYEHFQHSFDIAKSSINDNAIYKIFISKENTAWIGTYFGGVNYLLPDETGFNKMIPDGGKNSLKGRAVSKIIADSKDNIWIGTEDKGISIYNSITGEFNYIVHNPSNENCLSGNNVHDIIEDKNGHIWVGTYIDGLNRISLLSGEIEVFKQIEGTNSISNNSIYSLYVGKNDLLYIGSLNGIDVYNFKTKKFSRFKPEFLSEKRIDEIIEDSMGNIWFCSYNSGLYRYNYEQDSLVHYLKGASNGKGLTSNSFISCQIDSQKRLWFGTRDGGLINYLYDKDEFLAFGTSNGIIDNDIYGILEDEEGNLWLSTNKGISKFNPNTKTAQNFDTSHGLIANQYNFKSYFKSKDGSMYFGAVNGLTYFKPSEVKTTSFYAKPQFVNFKLFNETIKPLENSILSESINVTKEIVLTHEDNVITFDFIAPNYNRIVNAKYYYYMEGFEKNWNLTSNSVNSITYTNLNPGQYNFKVKVVNDNSESFERSISVVVLASPLLSNTAKLIYLFLFIALTYFAIEIIRRRQKDKLTLKFEKIEKKNIKELNQHKLNFFTYISHEFKTPLTIIMASIEDVLQKRELPNHLKKSIQGIERNAVRLQFLISQLMEFRKIETDHAKLNLAQIDIIGFLRTIFDSFNPLFDKKNIDAEFSSSINSLRYSIDQDKFEKIISNLLSNAYKNTNAFGSIHLKIQVKKDDELQIDVKNSGTRLTDEEKSQIFEPFYVDKSRSNDLKNSGIGLALVNSLVKLLNGTIEVINAETDGTLLRLSLPINKTTNTEFEKTRENENSYTHGLVTSALNESIKDEILEITNDKNYEILIVEDNAELLSLLKGKLSHTFNIKTAKNGLIAMDTISKGQPDLILSDVMMPEMDGFELCKKIKESIETSHIPIVLLTAMTEAENRIDGFHAGADAYISKPFIFTELLLIINNIINSKIRLKEHFRDSGLLETKINLTNQDEKFVSDIRNVVLKHLENPNFDIDDFTKEVGVSRTVLYVKIKNLLDLSTLEFINTIKLNEAAKLLATTNLSVSEVAYKTGFTEPNYFSRIFKKFHKVSPSRYKKDIQNSSNAESL